ncbi:MAG: FAD:protein FMN transferase [Pseudomonadota bacterium]|nr:FAD:protein FMN transferase [Pseudomonadota bacterium]
MGPVLAAFLVGAPAHAETVRTSRLAMGTVVGIAVVTDDPAGAAPAIEAGWAAIEAGEAELSEWRPGSATSRLAAGRVAAGGAIRMSGAADRLFTFVGELRDQTGGAFDISWRAPAPTPVLSRADDGWSLSSPGPVDLGGVLKGWLVDRAAEALRAGGLRDFMVDAAGDIYAAGDAEGGRGWLVDVEGARRGDKPVGLATVRLRDAALSTSGNAGQPGHIHDAVSGRALTGERVVSVVAPSAMVADGLATALYASGWREGLAERHDAVAVDHGEAPRWSRGARRVFLPPRARGW